MTVYISADAKNLREELASLRNQGGYQEQQFYFDGLVTNGTFDSDLSGWTVSSGLSATVVSGEAVIENTSGGRNFYSSFSLTQGNKYHAEIVVSANSGSSNFRIGTGVGSEVNGARVDFSVAGTYQLDFTAGASGTFYLTLTVGGITGNGMTIDNISVFETDGTNVIHTMPKGWKPKDVFEDGLLQREGAAHDYEVVYDGFDYVVKPTVAPSATTQTCVIGVKA